MVAHIRQKEVISVSVEMVEYTVGNALPNSTAISNILSIINNRFNSYSGIKSSKQKALIENSTPYITTGFINYLFSFMTYSGFIN